MKLKEIVSGFKKRRIISEFEERTVSLIETVRQYTFPLNSLVSRGIAWGVRGSVSNIPFAGSMKCLEIELEELLNELQSGNVNSIYEGVESCFRPVLPKDYDSLHPVDAISNFVRENDLSVIFYRRKKDVILKTPYKDAFLRKCLVNVFSGHYFFEKEDPANASDEAIKISKESLRELQKLYEFDVRMPFEDYHKLLIDLHEKLQGHITQAPTYKELTPRRIPKIDYCTVSDFVSGERRSPNDFEFRNSEFLHKLKVETESNQSVELMLKIAEASDWREMLPSIAAFTKWRNMDPSEKYQFLTIGGQGNLEGIKNIDTAKIDHIIGQEENVGRLYNLLTAFAEGEQIPFVLLYGETGTGKSLSVKAITQSIKGIKTVLLSSNYLGNIGNFSERIAQHQWRTILYVDDMHLGYDFFEGFKTGTQGMKKFPENVALIASANPEGFDDLPVAIKRRFPVRLNYSTPDMKDDKTLESIFKVNCDRLEMELNPSMIDGFRKKYLNSDYKEKVTPVTVYDFLAEARPILRSSQNAKN